VTKPRAEIMYIAALGAANSETLWARIGRVRFSKTGRTVYYDGRQLRGSQGDYGDWNTRERFHIRPARADGLDPSEGRKRGSFRVEIDDDVREEYWRDIRREPERRRERFIHS
jgi:hypothetical protein